MRSLVFSDSHEDTESMESVIKRFYPDMVLHLGDCIDDILELEKAFPDINFSYVRGNVDCIGEIEKVQQLEQVPVFMTHGDKYYLEDKEALLNTAMDLSVKIVLYGHTHSPVLYVKNGIVFLNPGTISRLYDFRTFGLIDVFDDEYSCEILFADRYVKL